MSVLTLELDPKQLRVLLKQTIKQAAEADPTMISDVMQELRDEKGNDQLFEATMSDVFDRFDDVFKALA